MSDAFNDDLSADMNDPGFAAEFERTTDDVRRERYAAAIRDIFGGLPYVAVLIERAADAAMALADEEIQATKMEATQIVTSRWSEESVRTNRLIQDLRSDLQESADALDESAQLLDDALDENTRLREKAQFFADAWERATRADFEKAQENERLRAELASSKAAHRAVWKLHQARGQWIFELLGESARLRAELETLYDGNRRALNTISSVRAAARKAKSSGNVRDTEDLISAVLDGEGE